MIEYRIIQFFSQPERGEAKNIGVIIFDTHWVGFKTIGMIEGLDKPDYSAYSFLPKYYHESLWVFREWIAWFEDLCSEESHRDEPQAIHAELNTLPSLAPHFFASESAYLDTNGLYGIDALDFIFTDIVGNPTTSSKVTFAKNLEKVLMQSELIFDPAFEENIEVTITPQPHEEIVFMLDYLYKKEGKLIGFKIIKLKNVQSATLDTRVNDAIYAFSQAQSIEMLTAETSVVLIDSPTRQRLKYIDRLSSVATVVDITKPEAPTKLFKICS